MTSDVVAQKVDRLSDDFQEVKDELKTVNKSLIKLVEIDMDNKRRDEKSDRHETWLISVEKRLQALLSNQAINNTKLNISGHVGYLLFAAGCSLTTGLIVVMVKT
ncbi:MAG: hypothetical protein OEY11_12290 [Gammaproteobacteria bacterium]|nr:hypothetical protein [Gammaproteobacteria bacterium]